MKHKNISRRKFLGTSCCAAMGTMPVLSSILNLGMMNTLAARPALINNDFKAMVCIGLYGGNDSFNMLVPRGQDEYAEYAATRGELALNTNEILPINPITSDGKLYGVHKSMPEVQGLFEEGKLAFIANVGTLVEPISNVTVYENAMKPLKLGSHSDQFNQWQTSVPQDKDATGWGGRIADILNEMHNQSNISMNISLSGRNIFQTSAMSTEYSISRLGNGAAGLDHITTNYHGNSGYLSSLRNRAIDGMLAESYSNIFQQTFVNQFKNSKETSSFFGNAIANAPVINSSFSGNKLSQELRMVAKTIQAQAALGLNRQTFYISILGWDSHANLKVEHQDILRRVSIALGDFYAALEDMNMQNEVTTFTISDFGRTLTPNANRGSDHAWGGNQIVMGGAVNGQEIYGAYPDLYLSDNPLNNSPRGSFIPTTSTDELFAELALWFGVSSGELSAVFPNIGNFYTPGSSNLPIGFMNI